jgi:hypothetical protein
MTAPVEHLSQHLNDGLAQDVALRSPNRAEAAHLAACGDCRALVEDYRTLGLSLAALRPAEPPRDFAQGVFARLEARARSERRLAIWGVLLLAPATLVSLGSLWLVARSVGDGASLLSGTAAVFRVLASLLPALAPLQAGLSIGCAAVCGPLLFAIYRLLPANAGTAATKELAS